MPTAPSVPSVTAWSGETQNVGTFGLPRIKKGTRLRPDKRAEFEEKVVDAYVNRNASIRALAEESGRSYGSIHRILAGAEGVTMRARGGAHNHSGGRPRRW